MKLALDFWAEYNDNGESEFAEVLITDVVSVEISGPQNFIEDGDHLNDEISCTASIMGKGAAEATGLELSTNQARRLMRIFNEYCLYQKDDVPITILVQSDDLVSDETVDAKIKEIHERVHLSESIQNGKSQTQNFNIGDIFGALGSMQQQEPKKIK